MLGKLNANKSMGKISQDYIAAIKRVGNYLESIQVELHKPLTLIEELHAMVENPNRSVYDLQCKFSSDYKYSEKSWYICYPYSLSASYLPITRCPEIKSYSDIKKEWDECFKGEIDSIKENCRKNRTYFNEDKAREIATNKLAEFKQDQKKEFLDECTKWIDVNEIQTTALSLKRRQDILMYSKENIGWSNFEHRINDELKICISTNFGYGSAAYFVLAIRYKDLNIIPYSCIVKYYKAQMRDIIKCTRQYDPRRDSWEAAFDFIIELSNQAQSNPEKFINEYVMNEVTEMMKGLRAILENPKHFHDELAKVKVPELIINVRNILDNDILLMRAYPLESTFLFKVEKIVGALHFLNNLQKISSTFINISQEIDKHIDELLKYNFELYPQIKNQCETIEKRIRTEEIRIEIKNKEKEHIITQMKPYKEELSSLLENVSSWSERTIIESNFKSNNPRYKRLLESKSEKEKEIREINKRINEYKNFISLLKESMDLIDSVRKVA